MIGIEIEIGQAPTKPPSSLLEKALLVFWITKDELDMRNTEHKRSKLCWQDATDSFFNSCATPPKKSDFFLIIFLL